MSTDFHKAAHVAVYGALNGNLGGPSVFDEVPFEPEGAPDNQFPFVTLGDTEGTPWDNDSARGAYLDFTLHVWSRSSGRKEVRDLMDLIYGLLHRAALSGAGYKFVDCLFLFSDVFKEADGKTRHGVIRFRITIQEG